MIPKEAINIVQRWEGLHKLRSDGLVYPYVCPAGVWTIGWGSTVDHEGKRVTQKTGPYTPEECGGLLVRDLYDSYSKALWLSPILAWRGPEKLSAIISFIYNLGWPSYRASTLRKRVNAENWKGASTEINRWVFGGGKKLPGLVARRLEESRLLWQQPI